MTVGNYTPQRVTVLAVDIAKNYCDVLVELPVPGRRRRMRVANNRQDFEHLAGYLRASRLQS
jgi:hypothetical protein